MMTFALAVFAFVCAAGAVASLVDLCGADFPRTATVTTTRAEVRAYLIGFTAAAVILATAAWRW